jgi:hypothetical protein
MNLKRDTSGIPSFEITDTWFASAFTGQRTAPAETVEINPWCDLSW